MINYVLNHKQCIKSLKYFNSSFEKRAVYSISENLIFIFSKFFREPKLL